MFLGKLLNFYLGKPLRDVVFREIMCLPCGNLKQKEDSLALCFPPSPVRPEAPPLTVPITSFKKKRLLMIKSPELHRLFQSRILNFLFQHPVQLPGTQLVLKNTPSTPSFNRIYEYLLRSRQTPRSEDYHSKQIEKCLALRFIFAW